jgi:hypothetical protein
VAAGKKTDRSDRAEEDDETRGFLARPHPVLLNRIFDDPHLTGAFSLRCECSTPEDVIYLDPRRVLVLIRGTNITAIKINDPALTLRYALPAAE